MKRFKQIIAVSTLIAASMLLSSGCTTIPAMGSISKKMPWSKNKEKPKPHPNPARMAVTWTPDTLVQTGRAPTRGFGGRLFFYDEKTKPVSVDGDLTVHAFAESANGEQGEVKRYHFTAEQFAHHFSQTDIGASYSVWIPWDAVGGEQIRVSLVPSFRAANGKLVQGEQALVGLPGKRSSEEALAVRPTAASILAASRDNSRSGLVTTTIPVRTTLQRDTLPATRPLTQTEMIASQPSAALRSFDVAPLGLEPVVDPRPLRLGLSSAAAGQGVVPASATLPMQ